MTIEPVSQSPEEHRHLRRLVSSLRAHGGVCAVSTACHADVPEVDGVVLSVFATGTGQIMISDSGPLGDDLEDLHAHLAQGPGCDTAVSGDPVMAGDLSAPSARARWPSFAPEASTLAIQAVFTYPVMVNGPSVAVLSLYRQVAGPLSSSGQAWARRYSEAAAVVIRDDVSSNGHGGVVLPEFAGHMQQAVGIVMELADVDAATALHRIRAYARSSARPMSDVVADVRTCRLPFDPTVPA